MSNNQDNTRPEFPKRAVITAGMPYGNKNLHFGHVGGVFVPADCFARFMRDRIGADNVLFVSGTDCYGSPIDEGYRKLVESGEFDGTIADYVMRNHKAQAEALANYDISLDVFEGSGIGKSAAIHNEMTAEVIRKLHDGGFLELDETKQFYDETAGTFLNGRQVVGRCPVQGCKSERAWADECELGHQYSPEELIAPKSTISGEAPSMRPVYNWYFKLPEFSDKLRDYISMIANDGITRQVVSQTIDEFLVPPIIYVKQEFQEQYDALAAQMPAHTYRPVPKGKASFELEFADLAARDAAREILSKAGVRFRTGKALVPLRITGNIDWGVPAPSLTDNTSGKQTDGLTVWCWPESLWAPISFTKRLQGDSWRDYWTGADARAYQFIGQDNIYFYGIAQTALWMALNDTTAHAVLNQSKLIANYHLLFLSKKASSSSDVKPPSAMELLDHYTSDQLRAHWLSFGLDKKPVSFQPKPYNPAANEKAPDPVLKESSLLTNVFNRLARSCFYTAQNKNDGLMPLQDVDTNIMRDAKDTILAYEQAMATTDFHKALEIASDYIRQANKYWSAKSKAAIDEDDADGGSASIKQVLANAFYMLRIAIVLMHPIAPAGTKLIFEHLNLDIPMQEFTSWEHIFSGYEPFVSGSEYEKGGHPINEIPPRFDFF